MSFYSFVVLLVVMALSLVSPDLVLGDHGMDNTKKQVRSGVITSGTDLSELSSILEANGSVMKLSAAISGSRIVSEHIVEHTNSPEGIVVTKLIRLYLRTDDSLRLIVKDRHISDIHQREDYVEVDFSAPVVFKLDFRSQPANVQKLLLPLTGKWIGRVWTFFYWDSIACEWLTAIWTQPTMDAYNALRRAILALENGCETVKNGKNNGR